MDPDALLKRIREKVSGILTLTHIHSFEDMEDLAEDINNLDSWISKGGFLPKAWKSSRSETLTFHQR